MFKKLGAVYVPVLTTPIVLIVLLVFKPVWTFVAAFTLKMVVPVKFWTLAEVVVCEYVCV